MRVSHSRSLGTVEVADSPIKVPLPGCAAVVVGIQTVAKTENAEHIAEHLVKATLFAKEAGFPIISWNSDAAATEVAAKTIALQSSLFSHDEPYIFEYAERGIKVVIEARDGVFVVPNYDVEHAKKSLRNGVYGGSNFFTFGS